MESSNSANGKLVGDVELLLQRVSELEARQRERVSVSNELRQSEAKVRKLAEKSVFG
jgi:hypothetical protein